MMEGLFQPLHLLLILAIAILVLGPWVVYIPRLQRTFEKCSPASRTMSPGKVWLLLIPLFNDLWHFYVVSNLAKSLENEFKSMKVSNADSQAGKLVGFAMCILFLCSFVPKIGLCCWFAGIVCWIVYWVKIEGYSRILSTRHEAGSTT
jgi:hypothetical protein